MAAATTSVRTSEVRRIFRKKSSSSRDSLDTLSSGSSSLTSRSHSVTSNDPKDRPDLKRDEFESISLGSTASSSKMSSRRSSNVSNLDAGMADGDGERFAAELNQLSEEEQRKIAEVMRRDTVVQLYTDLKVR